MAPTTPATPLTPFVSPDDTGVILKHPTHQTQRTLSEIVNVPDHAKRSTSAGFRALRKRWIEQQDRACLVCGVRQSTLHDPTENPHGATQIELHHRQIEWSLAGCIDLAKFNQRIVARYRARGLAGYERDFTQQQMLDWIDHGELNLWPLCDACHRSKHRGIHSITGPIWGALDLLIDGYELVPHP